MASAPQPAASERLFVRLDDDPLYAPETSVPAGTLREFAVPRPLAHAVVHVTAYEERLGAREEVRERVLPDGSAHEIAHRAVPWDELVAAHQRGLPEQLQEAGTDARRVALLARTLHSMLDDIDGAAMRKVVHAAGWLRGLAGLPVPEAADRVGLSERRLQQLFQAHVGLSPRAWRRLARVHDCVRLLRRGDALPWASVAAECGFSDQAHLGHEFRAICGLTPAQFLQRTGESLARQDDADTDAQHARQA